MLGIMEGAYQVIARRWRPRDFSGLVGQEHIVRTLRNAIERQRIAHAYLFIGPRGTGKTSTARLLSCALNCEDGPRIDPSPDSDLCREIMTGQCMDVIEIDGASNNSVDQIRELREECQYAPTRCRFKIYIIDEVHMLSTAAFNALLKTLEEPPPHVKFIFATTESQKVLPTIVSRCQRFEFRPIAPGVIVEKLREIAESEKIRIEENALHGIARLAAGGMRDAQSILDQLISFCGDDITEQHLLDVYGLPDSATIEGLAEAIALGDHAAVLEKTAALIETGCDLHRALQELSDRFRSHLLDAVKQGGKTRISESTLSSESILRLLDVLREGIASSAQGISEQVHFEITLLKAIDHSRTRAIDTVIRQLSALADELPSGEDPGAIPQKKKSPTAG